MFPLLKMSRFIYKTQVGEPCYGWPYCMAQRAPVYVMQFNMYEKAIVKFRCSFCRRSYLCFYDGPRTRLFFSRGEIFPSHSFFSYRETFELRGTITSLIYMSVISWNNSNFKSITCFNYSCIYIKDYNIYNNNKEK